MSKRKRETRRQTAARMPTWLVKGCAATRVGRIAKRNHATRKMGKLGAAGACVSVELSDAERAEIERQANNTA